MTYLIAQNAKISKNVHKFEYKLNPMKCKYCDIDFDSIGDLTRHDAIYHLEKSFDEFEPQNQVVVIFEPHPEIKPFKDSIPQEQYKCCYKNCNKSFFTESLLDFHLEKVHNQKIV